MEESFSTKQAAAKTKEERAALQEVENSVNAKVQRIKECTRLLIHFKDFLTEESWNERYDLPLALFLTQVADTNMRIFLGMASEEDKQVHDNRIPRTKVRSAKNPEQNIV